MSDRKLLTFGLIGIVAIMVLSYVLFPSGKRFPSFSDNNINQSLNTSIPNNTLGTESQEIKKDAPSYSENVSYPKIVNLKDADKQDKTNKAIEEFATGIVSTFEDQLQKSEPSNSSKNSLLAQYLVSFVGESLISVSFSVSEDLGGAQPNNYITTFNYNIIESTEIQLGDVFKKGVDYTKIIGDICKEKLLAQFGSDESLKAWIEEGTKPKTGSFVNFTITGKSLVIYFNPYEVGPYAMGIQTVEIDFTDLQQYLNSEGILGDLM
ncbi:MAG: DUF3298 domain-containing protein [Candidatus Parcubacteria bacterium]|nr:DUF3298 domain-containing protein [Candidatus Parcubacteria bacterium]